ncbi:MAG: hypothetical protein RRC34_09255 [Lentisphaeria bacterium]|nr:hypothetical protein [Lentisphaeria bacterium]
MRIELSTDDRRQWENRLAALSEKYDVTLQLAEVIGKRWSYLVGPTASTAGLTGLFREKIGAGLGIIIFPRSQSFTAAEKARLLADLR